MPLLPSVAQFHFETSIGDALLSEFRKTMEEGGKWNGDVKHTSLYSYWVTFHSEYQEESLDQLAEALPPLPNPVAPMIRSTKRIDAITSQESVSFGMLRCIPDDFITFYASSEISCIGKKRLLKSIILSLAVYASREKEEKGSSKWEKH